MPGRPKPTALKRLEGNPGKRLLPTDEPQPLAAIPECPTELRGAGKKAWAFLAPRLYQVGLLTEIDGYMLTALCEVISTLSVIWKEKRKKDFSCVQTKHTIDGAGNEHLEVKQNPWLVMEKQYMKELRSFSASFGLSARDRAGLTGLAMEKDVDEFEIYMTKKRSRRNS